MNRFNFKNKKVRFVCYLLFIILNLVLFIFSIVKREKIILFVTIFCLIIYLTYLIRFIYKREDNWRV